MWLPNAAWKAAHAQAPLSEGTCLRRSEDVPDRVFVAMLSGAFLAKSPILIVGAGVSQKHSYNGYAFDDDTEITEDGRYRARVILKKVGDGRARSQRFIDLETFANVDDARQRVVAIARAWIDEEQNNDKLALPTSFSPWC